MLIREENRLNNMVRRRLPMDKLELEFVDSLEVADNIFKGRRNHLNEDEVLDLFERLVITLLVNRLGYHSEYMGGEIEILYDEIFDNLRTYYKERIIKRFEMMEN